ncbi:helix-turn-helix domain-containing protein [Litoribacillus peritrichatus]|uniref:Helix-turn-helix domain-containing protein n=1 Tax=Litoribacillus peritrichatus TaxID=718191 RepID=A0ABP7N6E6_9GAMM
MQQLQDHLPSAEESALAKICSRELSAILESGVDTQTLLITDPSSEQHQVQVPSSALRLLVDVLTELGEGNTVKLIPVHAELTTQEAADMLNVSRPTFIKLLDEDTIPYTRTGNRRKVKFADVKAYKDNLEQQRLTTLEELSELDQDLGLGY